MQSDSKLRVVDLLEVEDLSLLQSIALNQTVIMSALMCTEPFCIGSSDESLIERVAQAMSSRIEKTVEKIAKERS